MVSAPHPCGYHLEQHMQSGAQIPSPTINTSTPISITCDANTGALNDYLKVVRQGSEGTITLGGKPLSEVKEPEVLQWAVQAVSDFFLFGRHAPVPGGAPLEEPTAPGAHEA